MPGLEAGFATPPREARPQTLWFWMNGHVTRDGITRDLEAMKRVGLGGAIMFDGGTYLPEGPAKYLSPDWRGLMTHATQEAARLGLTLGMHNAPGWSSTGGPWITPERAMQQLVWTETTVRGGAPVEMTLAQPQTNLGFYRDAYVLAFPAPAAEVTAEEGALRQITTASGNPVRLSVLSDDNLATSVPLTPSDYLQFEFDAPTTVSAVTVAAGASGRFPTLNLEASDDGVTYRRIATVRNPGRHGIQPPGVANFPAVRARFFRVVPTGAGDFAEVQLHRAPRIEDWNYKASFAYRIGRQVELPAPGDPAAAVDPAKVVDLTSQFDRTTGRLKWTAPALPGAGTWTILRIGHTPTGQLNVSASAAGTGLECDKFTRAAIDYHFERVIARVLADAGAVGGKSFSAVEVDSYETGMQNWSATFPEEFRRRAGYDLRAYLPAMAGGRIVGDAAIAERFLFDVRRVQADLMAENYYGRLQQLCREHGLKLYVEGYGQGVFDELQVSGLPDFPMTEFWERTPWTPNRVVKMVASAAHVYGKSVVASESFTGEEETARWEEYPYSLKILGDEMFALGLNQMVFHRFAHQPHPTAVPGMAMGPWGSHFDRTNTWFEQSGPWLDYLARSQFLLRQGTYVADVLYFVGERPPDVAQYAMPVLPAGYNYDLVNAEVLLTRASVRNGQIVLRDGGTYRVLMLPPDLKAATPELMRKLREFASSGVPIVGAGQPEHSLTLRGYPQSENEVRQIADLLWKAAGPAKPRVIADRSIADVLHDLAPPDLEYSGREPDAAISWTHRRLPEREIYFVANRQRRPDDLVVTFRVNDRAPEIWNAETGERKLAAVYAREGDRMRMPLRLGPAESIFVVFHDRANERAIHEIMKDGRNIAGVQPAVPPEPPRIENSFTMTGWARPDINLRVMPRESATGRIDETGKFYVVPASEGDARYGSGHAMAGLAIGRNGAFVIERSSASAPAVLVANVAVSGWTHYAVVYRSGKPRLYLNGKFVREGVVSGSTVHPGIGSPPPSPATVIHFAGLDSLARSSGLPSPPSQGLAFYFEGNLTRPELFDRALSDEAIAEMAAGGLPPPEELPVADVTARADGVVDAMVWQTGAYQVDGGAPMKIEVAAPREIAGPWDVAFEQNRGAPESVQFRELTSWHRRAEPGVKYFSGTATYARSLDVPADFLRADKRVVLDLGRVEVIAHVKINGRDLGGLWKEPYRVDITNVVHAGANDLEVAVTNLWPNRMIGDEQLPAENEYSTGGEHGIRRMPVWYLAGQPKPAGGRVTFTTWKFFSKDDPLFESGLLGPVRLLNPVNVAMTANTAKADNRAPQGFAAAKPVVTTISDADLRAVYDDVKTPFKYGVVLRPPSGEVLDCPSVFRHGNSWFMLYVANREKAGYETLIAESPDLLHWTPRGKILPFAKTGWDAWQADGGVVLVDPEWGGSARLQAFQGRYWMTYLGGAQHGYEPDPLSIGIAWTTTPADPGSWTRYERNPVLGPRDADVRAFEAKTLYKSQVIWDRDERIGAPFVMFYNGKQQAGGGHERIGMAVSNDMLHWRRYGDDPVIVNGEQSKYSISGDPQIVRWQPGTNADDGAALWVMFYFGAFWQPNAFDTFACSRDLVHWTKWTGAHLIEPSEPWDKQFAHKPWVLKHDGVVYHFYCAVGDQGRAIAVATSKDLKGSETKR